jgi:mannan endo-1,6-alpha-mannosidase
MWGAMVDYYHYTGDPSYNDVVINALTAKVNTGSGFDFMPPEHAAEEGNDDLGFWGYAVLAAAERNFPQPIAGVPSWLDLGRNIFDSLASRWNATHCGGGLLWQIFESNPNGMNYKNSVSNGGFFQLAARLYRASDGKEAKYLEWAERVWDWSEAVGFIDSGYNIYDGADARDNCTKTNFLSFTYSTGIYLYGAAVLANQTGDQKWVDRSAGILDAARSFFWNEEAGGGDGGGGTNTTAKGVMFEPACETVERCNVDMKSFKGYLARFMWQSTYMVPSLRAAVDGLLEPSARAAAATCTGGPRGDVCGQKWYVGRHDGSTGLGQQMCVLETVQGLLIDDTRPPLRGAAIQHVTERTWLNPHNSKRDDDEGEKDAAGSWGVDWRVVAVGLAACGLFGYA